ncbi:MAG TPA: hypothetical protein VKY66_01445 [Protaetiibacter sp.]|nr:hypothetical protein [Protaetiibacter sp.]
MSITPLSVRRTRGVAPRLTALAAVAALAVGGLLPAAAAHADSAKLHLDPYVVSAKYGGIAVDIKALVAVDDLDEVRVTVARTVGPDVVKVSKSDGTVVQNLKAGTAVTAPIVITPGSYDEANSTSWVKPDAVWAAETIPTDITVELLDAADKVLLARTVPAPTSRGSVTLEDVMPAAAAFTNPAANFRTGPDYSGIVVDVRVSGVTDAEEIIVQVARDGAAPVVKTSRPALLTSVNTGKAVSVSAPIVIQAGTYPEAKSGSWFPAGAVWTSTTTPTSVTITITRTFGPDLVTTLPINGSIDGIMPSPSAPVELELPADAPLDVQIPADAEDVSVKLGTPAAGVLTTPAALTASTVDGVTLELPQGTTVTAADSAWDGVIQLPTVTSGVTVPSSVAGTGTATVGLAIEVGSDATRLDFDAPVKLVLPGQAGKKAGFISGGGPFTVIDQVCPSATPALAGGGACTIDDGADLVIWTTHFTVFVAFSVSGAALAATGAETGPLVGAAALLLLLGAGVTLAVRRRRAQQH